MPIHPIQRTRAGDASEVRLARGCVVEFEQHGKPILSVVLEERKDKWLILTERGEEAVLGADRLFLIPGSTVPAGVDRPGKISALKFLSTQGDSYAAEIPLDEIWENLKEAPAEYSVMDICRALWDEPAPVQIIAIRHLLIRDRIFFKRIRNGFEPKTIEGVAEAKEVAKVAADRDQAKEELETALLARLGGDMVELPPEIYVLEDLAALGSGAPDSKIALEILDVVSERSGKKFEGRQEERAFKLLVQSKHFSADEDLNIYRTNRSKTFSKEIVEASIEKSKNYLEILDREKREVVSGTSITIDAEGTQDIDDALSLEPMGNGWKLGVHISDVTLIVDRDGILDEEAYRRATTIYAPDYVIPMLPRELSEGCVSLIAGERRGVLSFYAEISPEGNIQRRWMIPSEIRVTKRLSYVESDRLLYDESDVSPMAMMLQTLWKVVGMLEAQRIESGALQFNRRELTPNLREGKVVLEESGEELPSRRLVSELMIFANESAALYGKEKRVPLLYRGQEAPEQDIPTAAMVVCEGPAREYFMRGLMKRSVVAFEPLTHSGLGVETYIQGTSPIRRYGDLVNQRQLVASLKSERVPYSVEALAPLQERLEALLDEANHIQRLRNRYFIQRYLEQEEFEEITGTIVKSDSAKALVELSPTLSIHPFYPRSGVDNLDKGRLGKKITLTVERNNPRREQLILRENS